MTMAREMSDKEILRMQWITKLIEGGSCQKEVAERLGISVRQVKRLKRIYLKDGIDGLISKKRGQASNHRIPESMLSHAMSLIGTQKHDSGGLLEGKAWQWHSYPPHAGSPPPTRRIDSNRWFAP